MSESKKSTEGHGTVAPGLKVWDQAERILLLNRFGRDPVLGESLTRSPWPDVPLFH